MIVGAVIVVGFPVGWWLIVAALARWIEGEWCFGWPLELLRDAFGRSRT